MLRYFIYAMLFIFGICLTSSESIYFPLPNIIGMLLVLLFAVLVQHETNYRRDRYKRRYKYEQY